MNRVSDIQILISTKWWRVILHYIDVIMPFWLGTLTVLWKPSKVVDVLSCAVHVPSNFNFQPLSIVEQHVL